MYRVLSVLVAVVIAIPVGSGRADNGGLMACMQQARERKIAETEVGPFIRDCMARQHGQSFGAPKDGAAGVPAPPACSDRNILAKLRNQYRLGGPQLVEITGPRETLLGPPPRSANQYATATTFIAVSRYCEGNARFASGVSEPIFWRIDQVKDDAEISTRLDSCTARIDPFENGCAHVIAGKGK